MVPLLSLGFDHVAEVVQLLVRELFVVHEVLDHGQGVTAEYALDQALDGLGPGLLPTTSGAVDIGLTLLAVLTPAVLFQGLQGGEDGGVGQILLRGDLL